MKAHSPILNPLTGTNEADFFVSPYYWENNNPSALVKTHGGIFHSAGEELFGFRATSTSSSDFEIHVLSNSVEVFSFRKFLEDGQKFGTINITNAECGNFRMLKEMYGSFMYVIFEDRKRNSENPTLRPLRHVEFFSEYQLCLLNKHDWFSEDAYYLSISNGDNVVYNGVSILPNTWAETRAKLFRNGFYTTSINEISYSEEHFPSKEEYYGNNKREKLNSNDLVNLLWKALCYLHENDIETTKPTMENSAESYMEKLRVGLATSCCTCNVVGFGWLPCLFAKSELNEADKYVLLMFERRNVLDDEFDKKKNISNDNKQRKSKPANKIVEMRNIVSKREEHVLKFPLQEIVSIKQDPETNVYTVIDKDGKTHTANSVELQDNKPIYKITSDSNQPGEYLLQTKWFDGTIDTQKVWVSDRTFPISFDQIPKPFVSYNSTHT